VSRVGCGQGEDAAPPITAPLKRAKDHPATSNRQYLVRIDFSPLLDEVTASVHGHRLEENGDYYNDSHDEVDSQRWVPLMARAYPTAQDVE
jgi:hypothetical protein